MIRYTKEMVFNTNIVEEFKNTSSIHGLSRFGGPELYSRRKLIWIILVLAAASGLFIFVILEFLHLSHNPTITSFTTSIQETIDFPAVTVCNLNQVKSSVLECFSEKDKLEASKTFYALSELSIILEHFGLRSTQTPIPGDVLYSCARNHSHQIGDMIRYCHFKQELIDCKDIFTPIMTELGVCYTFNKDAKMVAESVGETAGLRFFVNIQQDLYFFSSTIQTGVKVVLHDPSEEPLPSLRGFLVGPGLSAGCSIRKTKVITLPSPYGSCREVSDKLSGIGTYSELTCFKHCFDDYLVQKCGCRHLFSNGKAEFCDSQQLIDCYAEYQKNISRDSDFLHNCSCPPNCETTKYETSLSYAAFTSNFIASYLFNQSVLPNEDYLSRNFIDLRLFYNSMIEEATEEVPEKTVGSILGTVGGQMGMFIGASILSIVEIIEFFCLLMTKGSQKVANSKKRKLDESTDHIDETENTSKM
ncbi:acid-sensing ion channel 1A-like isoform X1 [Mytilus galloprovincialis]|uniref:acid-sensing ion channel 1A-like isoform X1 n=1 Tax=Mytilus galloprovincialis TaxID=29158 RepID=UPI003F7BCA08